MMGLFSSLMSSFLLLAILGFGLVLIVSGNAEVDALYAWKMNLSDPNSVLQSWDATLVNPCTWFNVTCNSDNSVTHIDLGNANLSGQLVPQLGQLSNLQNLEAYGNNLNGTIPDEFGNLTNLVSLELFFNRLSGPIPGTLGKLQKLRELRLNNNNLSGNIPMSLTNVGSLQVLDFSNNHLTGDIPNNGSFSVLTPLSFHNNPGLKPPKYQTSPLPPAPSSSAASSSVLSVSSGSLLLGLCSCLFSLHYLLVLLPYQD
ncbi:hypothetical protein QN277_009700 [Acacia crassicarpa]|uniref:Leucine-rich repeat-containing N-terminal plant-type domain-containing protein n=1 Tax=Acacia crassicarpa TaxID=499986 RepID=A0AAE1IPK3_9FABA|nr:hypothetical protein QN277_009700 [Acacia crassicarpa]